MEILLVSRVLEALIGSLVLFLIFLNPVFLLTLVLLDHFGMLILVDVPT